MKKFVAVVGMALALAACSTDQRRAPVYESRPMTSKIGLDVKRITLADRSGMSVANSPYNSNAFTPTISEAIKQWAIDRLQATGQTGQAIVLIKRASLTSEPLPMESGVTSWFTRQQAIKYTARAEVSIEANGQIGFAVADASAMRAVTLAEDPSSFEKQEAYYALLTDLMKDLGENLETSIRTHMANFIVGTPVFGSKAVPLGEQSQTRPAEQAPVAEPEQQPAQRVYYPKPTEQQVPLRAMQPDGMGIRGVPGDDSGAPMELITSGE